MLKRGAISESSKQKVAKTCTHTVHTKTTEINCELFYQNYVIKNVNTSVVETDPVRSGFASISTKSKA